MKNKYLNYLIIIIFVLFGVLLTTRFTNVFGSNTDWINQHTVIPEYFRTLFYETGKILPNFSLNYGAGQNIYNLSYYGFLSPIILLSYLFPFISMVNYITITNIVIIIISGILFYNFLQNHKFNNILSLLGALLLVLSAPFIFHMHRHIMFVNYMPFLIMALMGVDNLFNKNTKTLLIISIFLMIMTSYYYSVGGIIVIGIYFIYSYFKINDKFVFKDFIKKLGVFIIIVLISILMASILLVPTLYTLLQGRGQSETNIDLVKILIPNLKFSKIFSGTYAIGLTVISFISILYLFFTKKKYNIITGSCILLILFMPFFRFLLNGGLYLREKCFIPFIPLCIYFMIAFLKDLFENKIDIKKFIIYLLFIFLILFPFNVKSYSYIILICFLLVLLLYNKKHNIKLVMGYILFVFITIFVIENFHEENVSKILYNDIFNPQIEEKINKILASDKSYYRMNNLNYPTKIVNKIYSSNYFTTNIYSSTYNNYYLNFVRNVFGGSVADYNYFLVSGNNNLLFNSYMGVKYLYSKMELKQGYIKFDDNIYLNENYYPLIYANSNIVSQNDFEKYKYPYSNELLMKNVVSNKNSNNNINKFDIKKINLDYTLTYNDGVEIKKLDEGYLLTVEDTGKLELNLNQKLINKILFIILEGIEKNSCSYDNINMTINDVSNILTCKTWPYDNKNNTFKFVISEDNLDKLTINLTKGTYKITNISTFVLDYEDFKNWKEDIKPFNITSFNSSLIKGNITIDNSSYLVTSIPYDKGFKVVVNNKEVSYENINNGFLGIYLEKGNYDVEITYKSPWLNIGKLLSFIGIISFITIVLIERKNKIKK